jgi:hypothetical protein
MARNSRRTPPRPAPVPDPPSRYPWKPGGTLGSFFIAMVASAAVFGQAPVAGGAAVGGALLGSAILQVQWRLRLARLEKISNGDNAVLLQDLAVARSEIEGLKRTSADAVLKKSQHERLDRILEENKELKSRNRIVEQRNVVLEKNDAMLVQAERILSEARAAAQLAERTAADSVERARDRHRRFSFDAKTAESHLQALVRQIEGRSETLVVPASSIADELAESFSFTELGRELKETRKAVKEFARHEHVTMEPVVDERGRKLRQFFIDVFDMKFEDIVRRRSSRDLGTMSEQILDAMNQMNYVAGLVGAPRISLRYAHTRIHELHLLVRVEEIQARYREEQNAIKAAMREEAKLQAEAERAMKQAEREGEAIRRAMDEAEARMRAASSEMKAAYGRELALLTARLAEAESKGARALSMAQQTKVGHVYIISNIGSFGEDVFKIGMTRRLEPMDRVKELGDASVPFEFDVHAIIHSQDAPALETRLHRCFALEQVNKVNPRKEFFRVPILRLRAVLDEMGVQCVWTLEAQAHQYRQSLRYEKEIESDPSLRKQWLRQDEARMKAIALSPEEEVEMA